MNKRYNKLYKKADPARTETEQHWKNICEKGITHDQHKVLGGPRSRPQQEVVNITIADIRQRDSRSTPGHSSEGQWE